MRFPHVINALAAVGLLGVVAFGGPDERRTFELVAADGAVQVTNSKAGQAVLGGANLRPGQRTSGTVTLGNPGADPVELALEATDEAGGPLWERLWIKVADARGVAYEGRLAAMRRLALGALPGSGERTFTLTSWVADGPDANALQGARASVAFTWLVDSPLGAGPATVDTPVPVPPAPPAPPAAPPAPAPAPAPTPAPPVRPVDPNTSVTPRRVISLPGSKACVSRRAFKIRIRAPRGVKVRTARVYVNNRLRGKAKGSKATINLRGLPKGTFRVKVRAKLANGRTLTLKRTYRTCAPKAKGKAKAKRPKAGTRG